METDPGTVNADAQKAFLLRRDRAVAKIVLAFDEKLLHLFKQADNRDNSVCQCGSNYYAATSSEKLELTQCSFGIALQHKNEGRRELQKHIKILTNLFHSLAILDAHVPEEDQIVCSQVCQIHSAW